MLCPVATAQYHSPSPFQLLLALLSFHPLFLLQQALKFGEGGVYSAFRTEHSAVTFSHPLTSGVSEVAAIQYKRKLVQPKLTAALFYGHKDNDLEDNFIGTTCSLNKRTVATTKAVIFPAVSKGAFHPLEQVSDKIQSKGAQLPPQQACQYCTIGASHLASQYCHTQGSQLSSTVDSSPPPACITQSTKNKASQQGGKLQIYHIFLILLPIDSEFHLIICHL